MRPSVGLPPIAPATAPEPAEAGKPVLGGYRGPGRQTGWNGTWRLQCAEGSIHLEKDQIAVARCERWGKNFREDAVEVPPAAQNGQG